MKKETCRSLFVIMVLILALFISCSDSSSRISNKTGKNDSKAYKDLIVSAHYASGSASSAKSLAIPEDYGITVSTGEEYTSLLKNEIINGTLYPEAATPSFIVLHLNDLQLFNTEDVQSNIFNTNGDYITLHNNYGTNINMLSTKGFSSYNGSETGLINKWHHLVMTVVSPWVGPQGNTSIEDPYTLNYTLSMVGVKLPNGISKEKVMNCLNISDEKSRQFFDSLEYSDEYVWFSFESLVPFNCHYPAAVVFSDTITRAQIYHKLNQGDIVSVFHTGYTKDGITLDSSNMSIIELPMETLDFSNISNPEIEISYHADNLIRFYDDGTGHYLAFFSPDNPFPISIIVKEAGESDSEFNAAQSVIDNSSDATPIFCFYGVFENDNHFTLQYTMPNYNGITGVEIVHNTVNDLSTATMIYEGSEPIFRFWTEDLTGEHYFWIRSVMANGSKSEFKQFRKGFTPN